MDCDIGGSYNVKENAAAVSLRVGSMDDSNGSGSGDGGGCFGLARFVVSKGKNYLQHVRAQYKLNLPFASVGSVAISPTFDFDQNLAGCTMVGKSGSGRTAAVLDLNWDRPTLSVVHALDQRNTIQPEISLLDAKIMYNWSVALESGGSIRTRVDPTEAVQISWIDQGSNGKWVTDFRLPLVSNSSSDNGKGSGHGKGKGKGALASDIRVRRQFVF